MKNIIKLILWPLSIFFVWQYRQVDALRADDSPMQTIVLYVVMLAGEFAALYFLLRLFGIDVLMGVER